MKKAITLLLTLLSIFIISAFVACGKTQETASSSPTSSVILKEIEGVTFDDATYTYDGTTKTATVSGTIPEGVEVAYTQNVATNAGTYNAKATLSGEGYKTKELTATLIINKADYDMSGVSWDYENPFVYDGEEKSVKLIGLPTGVSVKAYTHGTETEPATYTATVTFNYDTLNYNAPTVEGCEWRILPNLKQLADSVVQSFGNVPDVWAFLPQSFVPANRTITSIPSYEDFTSVAWLLQNGMGKQLNMVYGELTKTQSALAYVNTVYAVMNTVKSLYTQYLDANPDNYKSFTSQTSGFTFTITVGETDYALSAEIGSVKVLIFSSTVDKTYGARIQLTDSSVIRYVVGEDSLTIATVALNVSALMIEFVETKDKKLGYIYEYLGKEGLFESECSALLEVGETYTTLIGTKGDFIPTSVSRNCEVYRNSDGKLVGTEVREELTVAGLTDTYNTLWYPLTSVTGITSIKKVDEMNGTNADTVYINGKTDTIHTKLYGGINAKTASRRFDIEFKTMYFWLYNETEQKYESVKAEIPMLFVQEEKFDSFAEDFREKNGITVSLNVNTADKTAVSYGYYTLLTAYDKIREKVTFATICTYCGVKTKDE